MTFRTTQATSYFLVVLCASISCLAHGGSINGVSGITSVSCDDRRSHVDMSWCTESVASELYRKCVVMIHKESGGNRNCDWQGCGPISLVGEKAKIQGDSVVEYGVKTPFSGASKPPATWNLNPVTGEVLPKFPYDRHYLTIPEFESRQADCKNGWSGDPVLEKICSIDPKAYDMNVYFYCMKSKGKLPSL